MSETPTTAPVIINHGGSAFPIPPNEALQQQDGCEVYNSGMSLRQYFAAKAMQALLSRTNVDGADYQEDNQHHISLLVTASLRIADAMISASKV